MDLKVQDEKLRFNYLKKKPLMTNKQFAQFVVKTKISICLIKFLYLVEDIAD